MDLSKYYELICKEKMLSKEEEQALMAIYKDTTKSEKERQKAKDRIIKANLRFVFKQAKKYSRNDPSMFEELISAGNEGLLVGLEKYDPVRKIRFLTYAGWWVIQRILKEMSKMRIVSLPIWKQQLAARISRAKDMNENMTITELKKEFPTVPEKDIQELYDTKYLTYYIDDLEDDAIELSSVVSTIEKDLDQKRLQEIINALPSPHKEIVILSFGLEDGKEMTFTQLSRRLILTREQLKNLKKEALDMLRDKLSDDPKSSSSSQGGA
jgi:RNA polymerase nonessential primary-like sigma factor